MCLSFSRSWISEVLHDQMLDIVDLSGPDSDQSLNFDICIVIMNINNMGFDSLFFFWVGSSFLYLWFQTLNIRIILWREVFI